MWLRHYLHETNLPEVPALIHMLLQAQSHESFTKGHKKKRRRELLSRHPGRKKKQESIRERKGEREKRGTASNKVT